MKKVLAALLLLTAPAWGQTKPATIKPAAKPGTSLPDDCAPIGRTAKGELVYSLKCENVPAPVAPQAAAPAAPPAAEEPDVRRSGVFGWSYDRR